MAYIIELPKADRKNGYVIEDPIEAVKQQYIEDMKRPKATDNMSGLRKNHSRMGAWYGSNTTRYRSNVRRIFSTRN